jgi:hypothetical protein
MERDAPTMDPSTCTLFNQLAPELKRFLHLQARAAERTLEEHLDFLSRLEAPKLDAHIRAVDEIVSLVLGQRALTDLDWTGLCLREKLLRIQDRCDVMLERARYCEFVREEVAGLLPRLIAIIFASHRLAKS